MNRVFPSEDWPESWRSSYRYDLQEVYGEISHYGYAYAYAARRERTLKLITEAVPAGSRVLDVAAAQGNFSLALAELGYMVTWNDLRADLADYVRLKQSQGQIHFAPGNVFDLAFPGHFDAILITEIIEHVAHPDRFLAKISGLVRPAGYIVMTTPNGAHFCNKLPKFTECKDPSVHASAQFKPNADGHIFLLHPEEIHPLAAAAGLEVESIHLFTNPLTHGHLGTEWILRRLPQRWVHRLERASRRIPDALARRLMIHLAARFRKKP